MHSNTTICKPFANCISFSAYVYNVQENWDTVWKFRFVNLKGIKSADNHQVCSLNCREDVMSYLMRWRLMQLFNKICIIMTGRTAFFGEWLLQLYKRLWRRDDSLWHHSSCIFHIYHVNFMKLCMQQLTLVYMMMR